MGDSNMSAFGLNASDMDHIETGSSGASFRKLIFLGFVTVPGVISNSVALFFIVRDVRKAAFPAIILLLALCCADLIAISLTAIRHLLMDFVAEMTYGLCASLSMIHSFFRVYAGILNVMMATDRVMAIGMPFYYKRRIDVMRWKIGCVVAAAATATFTLLPVVGLGNVMVTVNTDGRQKIICTTFSYQEEPRLKVYGFLYVLVGFLITLTIVVGNIIVVRCALKLNNRIVNVSSLDASTLSGSDSSSTSNVTSFEVAFAKLMGCLAVVYLLTGIPYYTLTLLQQLNKPVEGTAKAIVHLMAGLSFTIDPIVYILIRKINRKRVMNFLFRCCKKEASAK